VFKAVAIALLAVISASPLSNPPSSIPPTAAFVAACEGVSKPTEACSSAAIANIDSARAIERLSNIELPADYSSLSMDHQMVAVTNAERTARGLKALHERNALDNRAQAGAKDNTDPIGPPGVGWGSVWAGGVADPLAADYLWMYDDGPNSPNGDCPHAGAPGCWGHRDNILGTYWVSMGAGHLNASLAELFVQ
jgi:hypothetical protein